MKELVPYKAAGVGVEQPFVHLFNTDLSEYAYDVNSLRIVKLSELAAGVLRYWDDADETIAARANGMYTVEEIRDMRSRIRRAGQGEGLFSCGRPKFIKSPYTREGVESALETKRQQLILCASTACNMRCKYCQFTYGSATQRAHNERLMSWEVAHKAIDAHLAHCEDTVKDYVAQAPMRKSGTKTGRFAMPPAMTFYGGEPLLNVDLIRRCVDYVRASRYGEHFYMSFTTNGTVLTDDIMDWVVANNVNMSISFDGPRDLHDRYRRFADGGGTSDVVYNNLMMIRDRYPDYYREKTMLQCVTAPPLDIRQVRDYFVESEVFAGVPTGYNNVSKGEPVQFWASLSESERESTGMDELWQEYADMAIGRRLSDQPGVTRSAKEVRRATFLRKMFDAQVLTVYARTRGACAGGPPIGETAYLNHGMCIPGENRTYVAVDGSLLPCERVPDQADALKIGHVDSGFDIDSIMALIEATTIAVADVCKTCWNQRTCALSCGGVVGADGRVSRDAMLAMCGDVKRSRDTAFRATTSILEKEPAAFDYLDGIFD